MSCLEVHIGPGESIEEADAKVLRAYQELGCNPLPFEHLNTLLPTSSFCHFFQVHEDGRRAIAVVNAQPWDENTVLTVLNILLNIRMDPDPPGLPPRFRFHGAYPVAPVLLTLFGDTPTSEFECRAALVVGYAVDLQPSQSYQIASLAVHLLRECFGLSTTLDDPDGDLKIAEAIERWFPAARFPEGGAPLNSIVSLGFLYGEILRTRLPYTSRWVRLREHAQWPVVVFGAKLDEDTSTDVDVGDLAGPGSPGTVREGAGGGAADAGAGGENRLGVRDARPETKPSADRGGPQIVFNPIASVIAIYQGGSPAAIREATLALARKCEETLGAADEN